MGDAVNLGALSARLNIIRGAKSPSEILGVAAGAAEHVVRDAYLQACRQYHPNRYAREQADARALALEVFIALKRAYEELAKQRARNGAGGPPVAAAGGRVAATEQPIRVAQGTAPIGLPPRTATPPNGASPRAATPPSGSPPRAATPPNGAPQRLGTAPAAPVAASPPVSPLAATRMPAQRLGMPSNGAMQKQREREERVQRALADSQAGRHGEARKVLYAVAAEDAQEKRWRVLLYLVWGHELLAEGKLDEAQKQYERSLALDASHEPTRRALTELDGKRKGKGFWKSFLGK